MRIEYVNGAYYFYSTENMHKKNPDLFNFTYFEKHKCYYCGTTMVSSAYMYIINKLKKAGLLDKDYKLRCCLCGFLIEKVGTVKCMKCNSRLRIRSKYPIIIKANSFYEIYCVKSSCKKYGEVLWEGTLT